MTPRWCSGQEIKKGKGKAGKEKGGKGKQKKGKSVKGKAIRMFEKKSPPAGHNAVQKRHEESDVNSDCLVLLLADNVGPAS